MLIKSSYITNTGKIRTNNEDCLLVNSLLKSEVNMDAIESSESDREVQAYVVADGMGGHNAGEVASKNVLMVFKQDYNGSYDAGGIKLIVKKAHETLNSLVEAESHKIGMGTAISGILFNGEAGFIFNIGDCRVYRAGENSFEKLSHDHSIVQMLFDEGAIDEEGMRHHPRKNIITSSISGDLSESCPPVFIKKIGMREKEFFLICTDGVWESLSRDEIAECFAVAEAEGIARILFSCIKNTVMADNASFIVLEVRR